MVESGFAALPTMEKEWSPRNSHCQKVEKQGGMARVNTLDLFSLLPSTFSQVSLISQIYPETRAFPGAQGERDWMGDGGWGVVRENTQGRSRECTETSRGTSIFFNQAPFVTGG